MSETAELPHGLANIPGDPPGHEADLALPSSLLEQRVRSGTEPLSRAEKVGFGILLATTAALLIPNLDAYPAPWFDEGWWLQIPRNLVRYGRYATLSGGEFRQFDTVVAISPAYFLPVAAAFELFGVGLVQARLVIGAQFMIAAALVFVVTRRLYGPAAALLAVALFVLLQPDDHWTSPLLYGRQMMAEVPALMWCLAGFYWWLRSRDDGKRTSAVFAGVALATSACIKPQFGVVLLPLVVVMWLVEYALRRELPRASWVLPAAMAATGVLHAAALIAILGPADFTRLLQGFFEASGPQVRTFFDPSAVRRALALGMRTDYMVFLVPALVYAAARVRSGQEIDIRRLIPAAFVMLWLAWFTVATPGWSRYALPAIAIGVIPCAGLIDAIAGRNGWSPARILRSGGLGAAAPTLAAVAFVVMLLGQQSADLIKGIVRPPERNAQAFAAYLQSSLGPDAVIETWEWQLAFLAEDLRFRFPPTPALNHIIARNEFGVPWTTPPYQVSAARADYIAIGWFSRWSGIYSDQYLTDNCELEFSVGDYELFRIVR